MNKTFLWLFLGILFAGEVYLFGMELGFIAKPDNLNKIITQKETTVGADSVKEEGMVLRILITNKGFEPPTNTIKPGTTIYWLNNSDKPVFISAIAGADRLLNPILNLGLVKTGQSVSIKFNVTKHGIYSYRNDYNPSQTGDIFIK